MRERRPGVVGAQHAATYRDKDDKKKHKNDRNPAPNQIEFIRLSTMVKLLETVLVVLREYPPFDALCRVPGKSDDDCRQPAQERVKNATRR